MGGVMKTCVVKFIRKGDAGDPAVTYRIQLLSATAHVDTDKVMRGAITWNVIKEVSGVETYINSSTGTHQCKLSSASSWSTAGSSGNNFNDNGLINGVSFSTAGSPTHLLIRFVLGGNVKCTLAVGISVDGVKGDFKSIVFKRTNTTPVSAPSGGSYAAPVPSGWSDSIPSGQAALWASECTFYGAGGSSGWSTPRQMTDTDIYDVEFSDVDQNPGTPSTNPSNWFDPDTDTSKDFTQMLWRAERECINGTWGSWTVVRIKGEKGDNAVTYSISLAGSIFYRDPNTETIYVDIKGKVYRNEGTNTYAHPLNRTDLSLYFLKEDDTQDPVPNINNINNGYTVSGNTFATKFYNNSGYANEKSFVVVLSVDGIERARESIQITKNGNNGTNGTNGSQGPRGYRGPALRGPQDWAQMEVDFQFYKGDANTQEPYEDFVVYNGTYYKCKKTHTKTTTNYPGSTADTNNGYWELTTKVGIVAANILFGDHGYFGSAIISTDWMISTNGTIDGVAYNNGATYNGVIAYSLFNPNNPLGKPIYLYNWTGTKTIASGTTTSSFTTVSLVAGKTYQLQCAGKTSNASGVVYVRLRNTSTGATYTPVMINESSDVLRSGHFNCTVTGSYYLEMYHTDSYTGTVNSCVLTEKNFAPVYALDLLTGTTYQGSAHIRGVIEANLYYSKTRLVTESSYQINPETEPYSTFIYDEVSGFKFIRLPKASDYDGMEITIFIKSTVNYSLMDNGYRVAPKENSGDSIYIKQNIGQFKDMGNNTKSVQILSTQYYRPGGSILLIANERYVFKSMLGAWYAIQGVFTGE